MTEACAVTKKGLALRRAQPGPSPQPLDLPTRPRRRAPHWVLPAHAWHNGADLQTEKKACSASNMIDTFTGSESLQRRSDLSPPCKRSGSQKSTRNPRKTTKPRYSGPDSPNSQPHREHLVVEEFCSCSANAMKRVQMVVEVPQACTDSWCSYKLPKSFKGENNHEHIDRVEDAHETEASLKNGHATFAQTSCAKFRTFHQSNAILCPSFSDTLKQQPRI